MRDAVPVHAVTRRLSDVAAAYGTVLRNPSLRRLQIVYGTSVVAEWGFLVALSVFAYDVRGATGVGIVGVVRMVPAALATPFAAVLSDRFRRELVLLWIELASAVAMAGAAIAFFAGPAEVTIYALAGLLAIFATLLRPTVAALLPSLATTPAELVAANAASLTTESLGTLAGPLLAGLVVANDQRRGRVRRGGRHLRRCGDAGPPRPGRRAAGADSGGEADRRAARRLSRRRAGSSTAAARRALRSPDAGAGRAQRPDRRHGLPSAPCRWELGGLPDGGPGRRRPASAHSPRLRLPGAGWRLRSAVGLLLWGIPIAAPRPVAEQGLGALHAWPRRRRQLAGGRGRLQPAAADHSRRGARPGARRHLGDGDGGSGDRVRRRAARWSMLRGFGEPPRRPACSSPQSSRSRGAGSSRSTGRWQRQTQELDAIDKVPIFRSLSVVAKERLATSLVLLSCPAGTAIVREGETGDRFYIVLDG